MYRDVFFNGVELESGKLMREPETLEQVLSWQPPGNPGKLQTMDVAAGVEPRDLGSAGWAVVFHQEDRACLEKLEPLLALRREQAGDSYHEPILCRTGERVTAFLERFKASEFEADPDQLPYYLLIVGPPERISFDFQCELDIAYAVGRISFDDLEDYHRYAENVVRGEARRLSRPRVVAFGTDNNEPLTGMTQKDLLLPLGDKITGKAERGRLNWELESILAQDAHRSRLERLMGGDETPSILLSVSHGVFIGTSPKNRVSLQGGLVCSDWNKQARNMERSDCFCGEDLGPEMDLTGMIAFLFACFSVGTPEFDGCRNPGQKRRRLHSKPIVSRLPQAMLAHPRGALAVIGHVDQCFQHSFLQGRTSQISHFTSLLTRLAAGDPVGFAMEHFNRRFAAVSARTAGGLWRRGKVDEETRLDLWLAWQDSRNYAVFGDPAVHIPLVTNAKEAK